MSWQENFKGTIRKKEPLKRHTSFKIGGPADYFLAPKDSLDLKFLITSLKRYKIPFFILGAGSNLLVTDKGLKAAVIKLEAAAFRKNIFQNNYVEAGSGLSLARLINESRGCGLSGLEFLAGIPGTVGGALAMNAGAWGHSIGELVDSVTVMDRRGLIRTLKKNEIKFKYRLSGLDAYIILSAVLRLKPATPEKIRQAIARYLAFRRKSQDSSRPNAGCVFKNPAGRSAGELIDRAGLKGMACGGAVVSGRHANFILNRDNASASDILKLMHMIKGQVKKKYNVVLKPEIRIWQ
jgi:UDP-N-acetylmuramate dehydrogenase